eukprot:12379874-Alexandrium_andersonii.AAC.1
MPPTPAPRTPSLLIRNLPAGCVTGPPPARLASVVLNGGAGPTPGQPPNSSASAATMAALRAPRTRC